MDTTAYTKQQQKKKRKGEQRERHINNGSAFKQWFMRGNLLQVYIGLAVNSELVVEAKFSTLV